MFFLSTEREFFRCYEFYELLKFKGFISFNKELLLLFATLAFGMLLILLLLLLIVVVLLELVVANLFVFVYIFLSYTKGILNL